MSTPPSIQRLEAMLLKGDYGRSAEEVLRTCAQITHLTDTYPIEEVLAFREKVNLNPQVWGRFVALNRDLRLKRHLSHLPASYTALYAVSRMQDEEIEAAIQQGVIHPTASSHSILRWTKEVRQLPETGLPPWRCLVKFDRQLHKDQFLEMRSRMQGIAQEYGASLVSEADYIQSSSQSDSTKQKKIEELKQQMRGSMQTLLESLSEQQRSRYNLASVDDFFALGFKDFASLMRFEEQRMRGRSQGNRGLHRPEYVLRIALEFLTTDSRSQRFNYKRRLQEWRERQPDLVPVIDEVLETYMRR